MNEKTKVKIGQILTCQEEFEIEAAISGTKLRVNIGDSCIVRSDRSVEYLTGEAKGKIQNLSDNFEIDGYDYDSIANRIFREIQMAMPLSDMMDDYDIDEVELKEAVAFALEHILE